MVQREFLAPRDIFLNFIQRNGYTVQAMAADHRTSLGPFVPVQSAETLRRLLAYLGATAAQLADFEAPSADGAKEPSGSRSSPAARTCCVSGESPNVWIWAMRWKG